MDETATGTEVVRADGHQNVSATHGSTFEVSSDDYLTPAGDCILGVEADRVPASFDDSFVEVCRHADATVTVTLEAATHTDRIEASGHPDLTFGSDRSMVVRTSTYVDDRTVAVDAGKAAGDVDRSLVSALEDGASLTVTLNVQRRA